MSGNNEIKEAHPGGSIAVSTSLDPFIVKSDNLTGNIVGIHGKLPKVWYELNLESKLLEKVIGTEEKLKVVFLVYI